MRDIRFDRKYDYNIDNIGFVSVERDAGYTFEFKTGKERYSFIYVENGELEYRFSGNKNPVIIDKDSLIFIPKKLPYKATYLKENTCIGILLFDIPFENIPDYLNSPSVKKSPDFKSIFNKLSYRKMDNTLFLSSKIYELLYILQNDTEKTPKKYLRITPAAEEIKQNYFENKSISYYSDMCNMSESNFRKLFKEYTGMSPIEYRNAVRIAEVKKMLDSGEFTVGEAAYVAGFNNMSFFYEVYNKYKT